MDEQQLREQLDALNTAIDQLQASDREKHTLSDLIENIERQLNEPLLEQEDAKTLVDQVDGMISSFETEHPSVAGILNNILTTLSSMGI